MIGEAREFRVTPGQPGDYLGDLVIAAPILGERGRPVAVINIRRYDQPLDLEELRTQFAPLLQAAARAAAAASPPRAAAEPGSPRLTLHQPRP